MGPCKCLIGVTFHVPPIPLEELEVIPLITDHASSLPSVSCAPQRPVGRRLTQWDFAVLGPSAVNTDRQNLEDGQKPQITEVTHDVQEPQNPESQDPLERQHILHLAGFRV